MRANCSALDLLDEDDGTPVLTQVERRHKMITSLLVIEVLSRKSLPHYKYKCAARAGGMALCCT